MRPFAVALLLLTLLTSLHAAPAPMDILTRALTLHRGVRDYTAQVATHIDVPDVDMPDRNVKVYVKPPDKAYVESKGQFVIIPKEALLFGDVAKRIGQQATVLLIGTKKQGRDAMYTLKIIPKAGPPPPQPKGPHGRPMPRPPQPANERVLMTVNGSRWTMEKLQFMEGAKQVGSVDFVYALVQGFWMPTRVLATLTGIPGSDKPGHFTITFSDYRINTGLTDKFFEDKQKAAQRGHHPQPHGPRGKG
jgi:hypothetical protein